ncbi:MAG: hypothetical protein ABI360_01295 [Allobranchiibius sp.]
MTQDFKNFDPSNNDRPRTKGWIALAIGLVCMIVLAPSLFAIGVWLGVQNGTDSFKGAPWTTSAPKTLNGATGYVVFSDKNVSTTGQCGAIDPSGTFIPFTSKTSSVTVNNQSELATFTTKSAGEYRLQCGDASLRVIGQEQADKLAKDVGVPVLIGLGAAVLLGLVGLVLTIVGIVRLVSSNGRRKQWQMDQQGGQPNWGPGPR